MEEIVGMVNKETGAVVCYDTDPELLLDKLEAIYQERILPRQLKVMEGHDPDGVLEATY